MPDIFTLAITACIAATPAPDAAPLCAERTFADPPATLRQCNAGMAAVLDEAQAMAIHIKRLACEPYRKSPALQGRRQPATLTQPRPK